MPGRGPGVGTDLDPGVVLAGRMPVANRVPGKVHIKPRADGSFVVSGVNGPRDFFGPGQPLPPAAQAPALGRAFDYPVAYNTRVTPRQEEAISFRQLKSLADGYDVLRTIIERRKDEMAAQRWTIGPKDRAAKRDARCDEVTTFFEMPDRVHAWDDWLRMVVEQLLVIDAVAIYPRPTRGGDLFALELLDGALIKRVITTDGRTPHPDEGPAYQQILKGLPAVDYITPLPAGQVIYDDDGFAMPELIYRPRNLRVDRLYGFSPVEQIVTTVNIALHRQLYQLSYYTNGSTPDLVFQVPDTWNPDQIRAFSEWWNSLLEGNLQNRRGTMFVPNGVVPYDTKEKALKDEYDEWLIRLVCFAFGVSPSPFIKQMNRATADTHQVQQVQEGLEPILNWVAGTLDAVIAMKFGYSDLRFRWEEDEAIDPKTQAEIFGIYVDAKIYHPDEVRQKLGDDPMEDDMRGQMDMATFARTPNAIVLPPDQQAEADQRAADNADRAAAHDQALVAAKPAVAPPATKAELLDFISKLPAPSAPVVNVAPPNVTVNTPDVKVDVHTPDVTVKAGDTFVDVGATTMHAKFDAPEGRKATTKAVTATRGPNGELIGTITETLVEKLGTKTVKATRNADGSMVGTITEED